MGFRKKGTAEGDGRTPDRRKRTVDIDPLSPDDRLDGAEGEDRDYPIYEEHLKEAFSHPELHNIAITGDQGVGKSSIIRTFDRKRNSLWPGGRHFLYISLMSFQGDTPRGPDDGSKDSDDGPKDPDSGTKDLKQRLEELERDLLRQLLYVCDDVRKVPGITYRLIPAPRTWLRRCIPAVMLILLAAGAFSAAYFAQLRTIFEAFLPDEAVSWFGENAQTLAAAPYGLVLVCLLYFLGKLAGWLFRDAHLSKLTLESSGKAVGLDKVGVDIQPAEGTSYLDRHGFELIYVLERMAGRFDHTLVFEDMDRLGTEVQRELFAELREINGLANSRLSYKHRGVLRYIGRLFPDLGRIPGLGGLFREPCLRFLYVAHDMAFGPEECAKFFDYILPVVPALSRESLASRLAETYLKEAGIPLDEQSEDTRWRPSEFLACAAPELNDYRTIHTILNEYRVFEQVESRRGLMTTQEDKRDLFAYVTYKNLCPADYYKIRDGKSTVFPPVPPRGSTEVESPLIQDWLKKGFLPWDCILFSGYSLTWLKGVYTAVLTGEDVEKKRTLLCSCIQGRDRQKGLCMDILADMVGDESFGLAVKDIRPFWLSYLLYLVPAGGGEEASKGSGKRLQTLLEEMTRVDAEGAEPAPEQLEESVIEKFRYLTREVRMALVRCLLRCKCPLKKLDGWLFRTDVSLGEAEEIWRLLRDLQEDAEALIELHREAASPWVTSPDLLKSLRAVGADGWMLSIVKRMVPEGKPLPSEVGEMPFAFSGGEEKPLQQWLDEGSKTAAAATGR